MPPEVASLVAADIILSARDEHPSFSERRHPPGTLLRALSRYQRRLVAKIIKNDDSVMVETLSTALPLGDFASGIAIPDYKYPAGIEAETGDTPPRRVPVELVAWQANLRYLCGAYLKNNTLYLTGNATDWNGFLAIHFSYMPEVDSLTRPADVLVVPNAAEPCLVAYLAHFMAQRGQKDPEVEIPDKREFKQSWAEIEDEFLDEIGTHQQAETSQVRETF